MKWEVEGLDKRGPCDAYLDGHLVSKVLAASPSAGMVKVADLDECGWVRINGDGVAFQIKHGHVRVEFRQ